MDAGSDNVLHASLSVKRGPWRMAGMHGYEPLHTPLPGSTARAFRVGRGGEAAAASPAAMMG
jgi:hypothetical protein